MYAIRPQHTLNREETCLGYETSCVAQQHGQEHKGLNGGWQNTVLYIVVVGSEISEEQILWLFLLVIVACIQSLLEFLYGGRRYGPWATRYDTANLLAGQHLRVKDSRHCLFL